MILTILILICVTIALMIWNLIGEIRMQKRLESGLRTINKRVKRLEADNDKTTAATLETEHYYVCDIAPDDEVQETGD